jgi:transcriptional regulator with XRE-family HTH domain
MQNIRTSLGERIRNLRKEAGWSQEQLGERADLHSTYIGGIERGERNISLDNLVKIAGAFGLSIAQLFDTTERKPQKTTDQRLNSVIRRLPSDARQFLLEYAMMLEHWLSSRRP